MSQSAVKKKKKKQRYSCWGDQTGELWDTEYNFLDIYDNNWLLQLFLCLLFGW